MINWDLSNTGMVYYNQLLKSPEYFRKAKGVQGTISYLTPRQYMVKIATEVHHVPVAREYDALVWKVVKEYAERMKAGEAFPIPVIDLARVSQEGRHRVFAAAELGAAGIPVLVVTRANEGPVTGEQPGMLGVPGKVHVQKRPYSIGQEELEDYGKYRRQMLIEYDKQYSLEQLREMCRAKGFSVSGDKKTLIARLI